MLDAVLGIFNLIRQGCLYLSTVTGAYKLTQVFGTKVELERQVFQYDKGIRATEPKVELENINHKAMKEAVKLMVFSYSSYRTITGEETPLSVAVSCGATALMLYQSITKATHIDKTIDTAKKKIFQSV